MGLDVSKYTQMSEKSPCSPLPSGLSDKPEDAKRRVTRVCQMVWSMYATELSNQGPHVSLELHFSYKGSRNREQILSGPSE